MQHHERVFNAPVRRIGNVRNAGQTVEGDVVAAGNFCQAFFDFLAEIPIVGKFLFKGIYRAMCPLQQFNDLL